jgi:hypothetical protein
MDLLVAKVAVAAKVEVIYQHLLAVVVAVAVAVAAVVAEWVPALVELHLSFQALLLQLHHSLHQVDLRPLVDRVEQAEL